jgi:hypothetical protein
VKSKKKNQGSIIPPLCQIPSYLAGTNKRTVTKSMLENINFTPEMTTSIESFIQFKLTNTKPKFKRLNLQDIINCQSLPSVLKDSLKQISEINSSTKNVKKRKNSIQKSNIGEACQILRKKLSLDLAFRFNYRGRGLADDIKQFENRTKDKLTWYEYWLDQTKIDFKDYGENRLKLESSSLIYQTYLSYVQMFLTVIPVEKGLNEEEILNYYTDQLTKASQSIVGFHYFLKMPD